MEGAVELNFGNWDKEISQSEKLTVVYFWHQQCTWCMRLNPILEEIVSKYAGKVKFAKLNVLENPANQEIASNIGVMSTPTLVFFCSGRPLSQIVGLMSKDDLDRLLNDMLGRYHACLRQSSDLKSYIV